MVDASEAVVDVECTSHASIAQSAMLDTERVIETVSQFQYLSNTNVAQQAESDAERVIAELVEDEPATLGQLSSTLSGRKAIELKTAGGGACSVHAAFGTDGIDGYVSCKRSRSLVRQYFCRLFEAVAEDLVPLEAY